MKYFFKKSSLYLLALSIFTASKMLYAHSEIKLLINAVPLISRVKPIMVNSRTLLPIRVVSETLGAKVDCNQKSQEVTIQQGNILIKFTIGQKEAQVNGITQLLDTPPLLHNENTMLPLRFVGEVLHCNVLWNAETVNMFSDYLDTILNIDYRTINKQSFINSMKAYNYKGFFENKGTTVEAYASAYVDYIIANKAIATGTYEVIPEMFWANDISKVITAYVTINVAKFQPSSDIGYQTFGDWTKGVKIPRNTSGKSFSGLYQTRLTMSQIDYNTSEIIAQLHIDTNTYGGAEK